MSEDINKEIEKRAYELYLDRKEKGILGSSEKDWEIAKYEIENEICKNGKLPKFCQRCKGCQLAIYKNKVICVEPSCLWEKEINI